MSRVNSFIVSDDSGGGRYLIFLHICAAGIRNRFPDQTRKSIGIDSLISRIRYQYQARKSKSQSRSARAESIFAVS